MKISIIICTYNRQRSVIENLNILKKYRGQFINRIYIIDNASNLPTTLSDDFVKIIYNKNLGGSGGYARGMYEASKDPVCTHIMLMDDDIKIIPESLDKACKKLATIGKNDWFAFAMRTFEHPDITFENTAYWTGIRIKSNYRNASPTISKIENIKYNYAGWWSLIMPVTVVSKYGYPMPYFIKSDDIEYGMRRDNEEIIYDNDIYVLHENFNKKNNYMTDYYNIRNHILTNLLHFRHSLIKSSIAFVLRMGKAWLTGKYSKLKLSIMGLKDLLKGPAFFINNGIDETNIRIESLSKQIKFNLFEFIVYPIITFYYLILFTVKHKNLKKDYLKYFKYLTSIDYWSKQFSK